MNVPKRYLLIAGIVIVLGVLFYVIAANRIGGGGGGPPIQKFTLNVWGV